MTMKSSPAPSTPTDQAADFLIRGKGWRRLGVATPSANTANARVTYQKDLGVTVDPTIPRGSSLLLQRVRSLRLIMPIAVMLFLASCGDGADSSVGDGSAHKNRKRWVLPLDDYFGLNYAVSDYAEALLIKQCMTGRGFAYPTGRPQQMDPPPSPTENDTYRGLFDPQIAAQYGYGGPEVAAPESSLTEQERVALASEEGQSAFQECIDKARQELPLPPDRGLVESLSVAAYNSAAETAEVRKAAQRWKQCMAPAGISDLPDDPIQMPTESLRAQWGESSQGEDPTYRPPTAEEITVAVMDAECRESSGFSETLYNSEWRIQMNLLADNEDALQRLKAANDEHAGLVEAVLTTQG